MGLYSPLTDFTGFLLFVPTLLAIPGLIFACLANKERTSSLNKGLIAINISLLLIVPIIHYGGTLLLGM